MQTKEPRIVKVEWEDAWNSGSTQFGDKELIEEPPFILRSTGYLVQNDKRGISLAMERGPGNRPNRYVTFIPRAMVRKVIRLREK